MCPRPLGSVSDSMPEIGAGVQGSSHCLHLAAAWLMIAHKTVQVEVIHAQVRTGLTSPLCCEVSVLADVFCILGVELKQHVHHPQCGRMGQLVH